MRNLGVAVEKDLNAAGIFFEYEVVSLGVEKTFLKMLEGRIILGRSAKCCNALYMYSIFGAIHDIDWKDLPEKKKVAFKKYAEKLRKSGQFK